MDGMVRQDHSGMDPFGTGAVRRDTGGSGEGRAVGKLQSQHQSRADFQQLKT